MKQKSRLKITLEYVITFFACALLTFAYVAASGIFKDIEYLERIKILANGFFVIGILCMCFGFMVMLTNAGTFDMIGYGIVRFFSLFKKDPNDVKYKTFYDYKVARAEQQHESKWFMVLIGILYILISVVFVVIWNG